MGNPAYKNDYTARQVYQAHIEEAKRRHDQRSSQWIGINIPFDPDFDAFADSVAYAIRGLVLYRTDGGRYARGLVRASGELLGIHQAYMALDSKPAKGTPIRLAARLDRRKVADPTGRWMLWIKFIAPDFEFGDDIVVTASPSLVDQGWKSVTERMLHYARSWINTQRGDRAQRIVGMLNIADRLGYPKNWNLFYYARRPVYLYIRWESAQPNEQNMGVKSKRGKMTLKTNGQLPFDGNTGSPEYLDWRIYPIRDAAKLCSGKGADGCTAVASQQLKHHEEEMLATFRDIDGEINRVFSVPTSLDPFSFKGKSAATLGPLALAFLQHLDSLTKDRDSFYSVYPPPKSFWFGGGYH